MRPSLAVDCAPTHRSQLWLRSCRSRLRRSGYRSLCSISDDHSRSDSWASLLWILELRTIHFALGCSSALVVNLDIELLVH